MTNRFLFLAALYIVSSTTNSIVIAAKAFSPVPFTTSSRARAKNINNNKDQQYPPSDPAATLLRLHTPRGGGIMKSTNDGNMSEMDEDDAMMKLQEDLKSMKFSYRAAFFSTLVNIFTREEPLHNIFNSFTSTLNVVSDINVLGFGIGIWQISRAYAKEVSDTTPSDMLSLLNTMRVVWFSTYAVLTLGTIVSSVFLKGLFPGDSYYAAPATVTAIAIASASFLASSAQKAPSIGSCKKDNTTMQQARVVGYKAARNMEFCMAGFALDAIVTCLVTLSKTDTVMNKCIGMLGVLEPAAIFILMKKLLQAFRPAVLRSTDPKTAGKNEGYEVLYAAETEYYTKIGKVLLFPALAKVLALYLKTVFDIVKNNYFG